MITITKNVNFSNWLDIRLWGELVDNQKNIAKALEKARAIKRENPHLQIVNQIKEKGK